MPFNNENGYWLLDPVLLAELSDDPTPLSGKVLAEMSQPPEVEIEDLPAPFDGAAAWYTTGKRSFSIQGSLELPDGSTRVSKVIPI